MRFGISRVKDDVVIRLVFKPIIQKYLPNGTDFWKTIVAIRYKVWELGSAKSSLGGNSTKCHHSSTAILELLKLPHINFIL